MKTKIGKVMSLFLTAAMLLGPVQTAYGEELVLNAADTVQDAKAVEYEYERLDQTPMAESVSVSSENTPQQYNEGPAALAFDGNNGTAWHTDYDTYAGPYWIQWNLGGSFQVGRVTYTPKSGGNNGIWKSITVSAKTGETDDSWQVVYSGDLSQTAGGTEVNIDFIPVTATAMKVDITDSYNTQANAKFASAGEINVYKATEKEPEPPKLENPISVNPATLTLDEGKTYQLEYILTPEAEATGGTVEWRVIDSDVISMDENGLVTAVGEGTEKANVSFTVNNVKYNAYSTVTVNRVESQNVIVLNGREYQASNLEDAISQHGLTNGVPSPSIESIEFKSGVVRSEDLDYIYENRKWFDYELKTFIIGDDVELRGLGRGEIPVNTFKLNGSSATELTTVYLGKNVKALGSGAFANGRNITSFEAPGVEKIAKGALDGVNKVDVLAFPSLKEISGNIFGTKYSIQTTQVSLPSLEKLNYETFAEFTKLEKLELGAVPPVINISSKDLVFASTAIKENLEFVIPEDAIETYRADADGASVWHGIKLPEKAVIIAKINGREVSGASLEDMITSAELTPADVESIEFVSGIVTQEDMAYFKVTREGNQTESQFTLLETLVFNIGEGLQLLDEDNQSTTILPNEAFESVGSIESVSLNGFTEIGERAFKGTRLKTVSIPNVMTIHEGAFWGTALESIDLPEVTVIDGSAFNSCQKLAEVNMPKVVSIGKEAFYRTTEFEEIHLPATIETINDAGFGVAGSGSKTLKVTIDRITPPTTSGSIFTKASANSTITVPAGSLPNYLPDLDLTKHFGTSEETKYEEIRVVDPKYHYITFRGKNSWDKRCAYVMDGDKITESRIPTTFKNGELLLAGWNTSKTGNGTSADAATIPTEDMTLYAQWRDYYVISFNVDGTVTNTVQVAVKEGVLGNNMPEAPVENGYVFVGWYTDQEGSGDPVTAETKLTADTTVYAVFEEELAADVAYSNSGNPTSQDVVVTLSFNKPVEDIDGWRKISETVFEKSYNENGQYKVTVHTAGGEEIVVEYEVKGIDKTIPTASFTQDITEWTNKNITVTMKTNIQCQTPEGWTQADELTYTKVFEENGVYTVMLVSVTGVDSEEQTFEILNIDKEVPVISSDVITERTIEVNDGKEYTPEQLVEMFTKSEWATDNSGDVVISIDETVLKDGMDGYSPFTSQKAGTYKIMFNAVDTAGNQSSFAVTVTVAEKDPGENPGEDPDKDPGKDPGENPDKDPDKDPGKDPDKDSSTGGNNNGHSSKGDNKGAVKTGDTTELAWMLLVMTLAAGTAVSVVIRRRREMK